MTELPLIFVAGILGAAHCLGMCGPFALMIGGSASHWVDALGRQAAYSAGRVFTYAFLGAAAGYCGGAIVQAGPTIIPIPAALAILAGTWLIYQGLQAAGVFRQRGISPQATPCLAAGFFRSLLRQPGITGVFLAGLFTGLLPCGLLYGMLALATSNRSIVWGAATLAVFGLGTVPSMVLAGASGRLLTLVARRRLFALAAWCLVLTGAISVARGVSFLSVESRSAEGCPLCRQ